MYLSSYIWPCHSISHLCCMQLHKSLTKSMWLIWIIYIYIYENYLLGREWKTYNWWNDVVKLLKLEILLKLLYDKSKVPNSNSGDVVLKVKSISILPLMLLVLKFLNIFPTITEAQINLNINIFLSQVAKIKPKLRLAAMVQILNV